MDLMYLFIESIKMINEYHLNNESTYLDRDKF